MSYTESWSGKINRKLNKKLHVVEVASGRQKADLVLKNATYVNVFCNELSRGDIAVAEGLIAGMGEHYEGADDPTLVFFSVEEPEAFVCNHDEWVPVEL